MENPVTCHFRSMRSSALHQLRCSHFRVSASDIHADNIDLVYVSFEVPHRRKKNEKKTDTGGGDTFYV